MNAPTEAPCSTLDRSMLHGKCPEAAKRKALGTGNSPRALGRAATARTDLGTWGARTGSSNWDFLEQQQRATSSGGVSFWRSCDEKECARWMSSCRSSVAPMDRKGWRRRQLTGTERKGCDDSAMGGSSSRWEGRLVVPRFIEREGHAEGDRGDHGGARVLIMRGGCGSYQPRGVIPDSGSASRRKMACRGLASGPWTTGQRGHSMETWAHGPWLSRLQGGVAASLCRQQGDLEGRAAGG